MKQYRPQALNGQEMTKDDRNITAALAATSMDQAISEFFRLPLNDSNAKKGVIPYGMLEPNANEPQSAGIVASSGATDRTVYIYPFRALVAVLEHATSSPEATWTGTRSVAVVPSTPSGSTLQFSIVLDATAADKRCDLVYCKITVNAATVTETRYVRDPTTGVISTQTIPVEGSDLFELLVLKGTGSGSNTPPRPTLPSDDAPNGVFYIPLAFVFLTTTFTGAATVLTGMIQEVAPVIPIARATGAMTMRVPDGAYETGGYVLGTRDFDVTLPRPYAYVPPTFGGGETLMIFCSWNGSGDLIPPVSAISIIDRTCDWRRRIFRWTASAKSILAKHRRAKKALAIAKAGCK